MARIKPFRGLRYDPKKIDDMEKAVTPPYDVISPEQQEAFYDKSPYNVVRLDFGKNLEDDDEKHNRYTRAAQDFKAWQKAAALVRDERPAIYLYHVTYTLDDSRVFTRKGFLCLVRLEDFSAGIVRPHEKTFPKVTSDRLKLMEHCSANFSPVFSLYPDTENTVTEILERHKEEPPLASFYDWAGLKHEMWAVTDPKAITRVQKILDKEPLFIADGHHRYTTALDYRRIMQERYPDYGEQQAFNHIMMYLCSMEDKGLVILPTHRLVTRKKGLSWQDFKNKAAGYFDIEKFPLNSRDYVGRAGEVCRALEKAGMDRRQTMGLYTGSHDYFYLLSLKKETRQEVFGREVPAPLQELDVFVLTELVLGRVLGLTNTNKGNDSGDRVSYYHNAREIMEKAARDDKAWAFLLNPTPIDQVRNVATAGLVMPHKSTYFYPKALTGLVINKIVPDEEV
ncbi:MAG: DUF1015 domain-containing protein [Thermodesulfobacteriota bacterium]|nr:DUF1015 domain-containing protein [Thermodesulfobacteriota bacterium]